jgi:hypothetical protein
MFSNLNIKETHYIRFIPWAFLILSIIFVTTIRFRLLGIPLERDEGEYAYMGQLILQGLPPFSFAYSMKLPGVSAAYALIISIFGHTAEGIHLGFTLINCFTIIMVFLLTRYLFGAYAGAIAGATYGILSISPAVLGVYAHATHFVVLPALCGIFLMLKAIDKGALSGFFWSGILFGIAFVMKQHGILFFIFAWVYFLWIQIQSQPVNWKSFYIQSTFLCTGAFIPFASICLLFWWTGYFDKFWFWTFTYAWAYASEQSLSTGFVTFLLMFLKISDPSFPLWLLAGIGLTATLWDEQGRKNNFFVVCFLIFSFLSVCPGLYFRNHYFVLLLPVVALLTGLAVSSLFRLISKHKPCPYFLAIPLSLFLVAYCFTFTNQWSFFFSLTPCQASRYMFVHPQPFCESVEIGRYIKSHTERTDRIAILGSEPQIYFYANRFSASGFIYTYPLMEKQPYALSMQKEMIGEIEKAQPEYIIFINVPTSWVVRSESEMLVFNWFHKYHQTHYNLVRIIDMNPSEEILFHRHNAIRNYFIQARNSVYVFRKILHSKGLPNVRSFNISCY